MKTGMLKIALLAATVNVGALAAHTASALPAEPAQSKVVKYQDLNLATNGGAKTLYMRLHRAAESVCGDTAWGQLPLDVYLATQSCEQKAMSRAVAKVDNPKLTALFDRRTRGTPAKAA